ncbi:MAG TPA: cyclic nucleotide-binding domain-containing protein, partial [Thermodesulfovibrionales bacterium]|nr:cyclic nucleotide-binding domain-containing protein [Thermodesulfovibrionales bacterium]
MGKNEIEHLKNIQLFSSLTDDELHQIKDKLSLKRYKKHEVILFEEDTTEYMYIILNGKTKVIQTTEDGKEILLAMHHSGEFFGEMSLLDGKTSPATVVAMEDSSVAIISRQEFYSLIRAQKRILDNLLL